MEGPAAPADDPPFPAAADDAPGAVVFLGGKARGRWEVVVGWAADDEEEEAAAAADAEGGWEFEVVEAGLLRWDLDRRAA